MPSPRAYVYLVRCRDGTFYLGTARDIAARIATHNAGPVKLLWSEGPMTVSRALRREYQLKQLTRAQKLALIRGELILKLPRRRTA
jgi:putative endonuclease